MATWPEPEPGLVIRYAYLWRDEAARGHEEGVKDRPCAVVLAVRRAEGATTVVVAPITHRRPDSGTPALEIPAAVKARLGLDEAASFVVADDLNAFEWPGPDLRVVAGPGGERRSVYGYLPAALTRRLIEAVKAEARAGRSALSDRSPRPRP